MTMKNKSASEIVFHDRWLTGEREEDNPYITCALYFLVVLMSLLLILVVFVSMCRVDGSSMTNSYHHNDHILMYRYPKSFQHNDVVVFDIDAGGAQPDRRIKRVVATAGDELVFVRNGDPTDPDCTAILYRKDAGSNDFVAIDEPYIREPMLYSKLNVSKLQGKIAANTSEAEINRCRIPVDEGFLYVMGDNRNNSEDSRVTGAITEQSVVGKEIFHFTQGSLLEKIMRLVFGAYETNEA